MYGIKIFSTRSYDEVTRNPYKIFP